MSNKPRYKHKLNMLEPGSVMVKIIGILILIAFILYVFSLKLLAGIFVGLGFLMLAVLLILVGVELHQDKMMYEDAKKEDKEIQ
ncbi:MAG TPA: hypothetical protein GX401_01915 [Clostridiales bacterium]|nr:hypothetical protein [Clostridiales bacterium]